MSLEKRIDEQEASLSPDQILLRWLDETMKFKSRLEYMMWVSLDWRTRHPFSVFFRDLLGRLQHQNPGRRPPNAGSAC